jgi:hypothetical protein
MGSTQSSPGTAWKLSGPSRANFDGRACGARIVYPALEIIGDESQGSAAAADADRWDATVPGGIVEPGSRYPESACDLGRLE